MAVAPTSVSITICAKNSADENGDVRRARQRPHSRVFDKIQVPENYRSRAPYGYSRAFGLPALRRVTVVCRDLGHASLDVSIPSGCSNCHTRSNLSDLLEWSAGRQAEKPPTTAHRPPLSVPRRIRRGDLPKTGRLRL